MNASSDLRKRKKEIKQENIENGIMGIGGAILSSVISVIATITKRDIITIISFLAASYVLFIISAQYMKKVVE